MKNSSIISAFVGLLVLLADCEATAQWSTSPDSNTAVCTAPVLQFLPSVVGDGTGGAIVTWYDLRNDPMFGDIYAQRVDAYGFAQWTIDGVGICLGVFQLQDDNGRPRIVGDGTGGAIITWADFRNGWASVYAQRVSASGDPLWATNGVRIRPSPNRQYTPFIMSDGRGGAIVAFEENPGSSYDIYVQRIDSAGNLRWGSNAVTVASGVGPQPSLTMTSDGDDGAIIAWEDYRNTYGDIYAQRVNALGSVQWTTNGAAVCSAPGGQATPEIVADGMGGAVIAWLDGRNGPLQIFAQRIDSSGVVQWATDGVALCNMPSDQEFHSIATDGNSGAIIGWADFRQGLENLDIYAQRIDASGRLRWDSSGVTVCLAGSNQANTKLVSSGSGRAIVIWGDIRSGHDEIYAQLIDSSGNVQWTTNGVAISTVSSVKIDHCITSGLGGGGIIAWTDGRNGEVDADIYIQQIGGNGILGSVTTSVNENGRRILPFGLRQNFPNPFNPWTTIRYNLSSAGHVTLRVYDVLGREVARLVDEDKAAGTWSVVLNGENLSSGVYFYRLTTGTYAETRKLVLLK